MIIEWVGRNNFRSTAPVNGETRKDGGIFFFSEFKPNQNVEVGRSYAFYLKKMKLTFVEQQTQIITRNPQVRALFADCKEAR